MTQVVQGPWPEAPQQAQYAQSQYAMPNILPSFPVVAAKLDSFAVRVPWWAWALAGLYVGWRFLGGSRRTVSIS